MIPATFQISPNIVVEFPDPDLGEDRILKLDHLTTCQVQILRECLKAGFVKTYEQEMPPCEIKVKIFQRKPRIDDSDDIGIGAQAGDFGIYLSVNPEKIETQRFQDTLKRLIPHEGNHIMRADHIGIPVDTVGDAIISEGFALKAEIIAGFAPADYNQPASIDAFAAYIEKVLPVLDTPRDPEGKVYNFWLFGVRTKDDKPNEAFGGYPLGHAIVADYLASGHQMYDAMRTPNQHILDHWKLELAQQGVITAEGIHAWAHKNFHWLQSARTTICKKEKYRPSPAPIMRFQPLDNKRIFSQAR